MTNPIDDTKEQLQRCLPVARRIIPVIAAVEGDIVGSRAEKLKSYQPVASKVLEILLGENVLVGDINCVLTLLREPSDIVGYIVTESMNKHLEELQEKVFGKQPRELSMSEVHRCLTEEMIMEF